MINLFSDKSEAISNSINIAKRCSFILKEKEPNLPKFFLEITRTKIKLWEFSAVGLLKRLNISNFTADNKKF